MIYNNIIKLQMEIRQKKVNTPKIRNNPLQKSQSMTGIIHGDPHSQSNHYIDALQRFKRDYASIEKEERQKRRTIKMKDDERRRNYAMLREYTHHQNEEQNFLKQLQKQKQSQILHDLGVKKTAHTESIAINLINKNYDANERGKIQANTDEKSTINNLVRSHHLQTCGNSGYNIINGRPSMNVDYFLPQKSQIIFEEKLTRYYSQFKIDPSQK